MRQSLTIHPTSLCPAVTSIEVDVARPKPGLLTLTYALTGAVGDLYVPDKTDPVRTDELWKRTCFEAFVLPDSGEAYAEFNIAPSTKWAAYRFDRYREGMRDAGEIAPLSVDVATTDERLTLDVAFDLAVLPGFDCDADWRLGLTAVIEEANGRVSYWALTHPLPKPEFHNADGFTCRLPAPEAS
jgi:hypothetical protein